ncbi:uncharacterized protein [Physcomitrium patens]|nr:uncharacterized protein LOC112284480 isoform X1 [Physcomitrium patens]|eukprot:XP_024380070.1 uncharacterized protein LOC112284480 isoform X1 [Physcomitrella patens]
MASAISHERGGWVLDLTDVQAASARFHGSLLVVSLVSLGLMLSVIGVLLDLAQCMLTRALVFLFSVHHPAWIASTMRRFEDTWNEQQPQEIQLGREKESKGVSNMKVGERVFLHISYSCMWQGGQFFPSPLCCS